MKSRRLAIVGLVVLVMALVSAAIAVPAFARGPERGPNVFPGQTTSGPGQDGPQPFTQQGLAPVDMGMPMKGKLGQLMRRFNARRHESGGRLLKVTEVGENQFGAITFNGTEVVVHVDGDTVYHDPLDGDASFSDITSDTMVRVKGPREDDTVFALAVVIVPEDMHRVSARGTVGDVSGDVLTVLRRNGKTVQYVFSPDVVRFLDEDQSAIEPGDRVWVVGWKANFSTDLAKAVKIVDFGQPSVPEPATQ